MVVRRSCARSLARVCRTDFGKGEKRMDMSVITGLALGCRAIHVVPGQIGASAQDGLVFKAIIGSCVVVCLHDPVALVGGMAHILFPGGGAYGHDETRFAHPAISKLMTQISELGGAVDRVQAKVFGGAKLHDGRSDIGKRNADFVLGFMAQQGVLVTERGLGGDRVRRVRFSIGDGMCEQVFITSPDADHIAVPLVGVG